MHAKQTTGHAHVLEHSVTAAQSLQEEQYNVNNILHSSSGYLSNYHIICNYCHIAVHDFLFDMTSHTNTKYKIQIILFYIKLKTIKH